jgi:hypothetical protein
LTITVIDVVDIDRHFSIATQSDDKTTPITIPTQPNRIQLHAIPAGGNVSLHLSTSTHGIDIDDIPESCYTYTKGNSKPREPLRFPARFIQTVPDVEEDIIEF